jgi:hypothetical protein
MTSDVFVAIIGRLPRVAARPSIAAVVSLAVSAAPAHALFDDVPLSPRARGLGNATVATTNDAWAFYYNPAMLPSLSFAQAGLATLRANGLGFNRLTGVVLATPLYGSRGGLAVGWRRFAVENGGVDLATENTLSVAHGLRLFGDASTAVSFGWTLNFYRAEFGRSIGSAGDGSDGVDPGDAWTVGFDLGAVANVYERTRVGFFTRNVNNPTLGDDNEELRRQVALGLAYDPYPGVTTALDVRNGLGEEDFRISGGVEMEIAPPLLLRLGLETQPNKVNGGCGIRLPYVTLDYGFSTGGGVLDTSHHFGLGLRWDRTLEGRP